MTSIFERLSLWIVRVISREVPTERPYDAIHPDELRKILQPGDVILIDGYQKISVAIKYLTQSTWSHAALYIGDALGRPSDGSEIQDLIEVEIANGCHSSNLLRYRNTNLRICRPHGLPAEDRVKVVQFMIGKLGLKYDMRNIFDLARYLLPTPPVPVRWRRRMIAIGSGDPTRAICSSLIAEAFQSVRYPLLPHVESVDEVKSGSSGYSNAEIYHIRHHTLFTPRDFDVSPYFDIIKPTIHSGFDYRKIVWADAEMPDAPAGNKPEA